MDNKKLLTILKREEGTKLDYKLKLELGTDSGKKELAKDICAIANSKGGRGYIIVGIADKSKEIVGLKKEDIFREEQVQQIITWRCEPPIPIEVEFIDIDEKTIGVITIFDGKQKPYQIRETGAFPIRRGSTTDTMRRQELLNIFENNLEINLEICPIIKSTVDLLNMELVSKYFRKKGIYINNENRKFLLEAAGITYIEPVSGKETCTYGGLIVFSEKNSIYISNNMIKIINKIRNDIPEIIVVQGALISMIKKCCNEIDKIIPSEYPKEAIFEAVKNAVLYREYSETNKIIEISITEKNIIIVSPGELIRNGIKRKSESYIRRNMWIYEKILTLDDEELFFNNGKGFSRMKKMCKKLGTVRFFSSKEENYFKVVLPGIKNLTSN